MRVVLLSNASAKHFPNNTVSEFTVKLPDDLDFSTGSWECGLSEIMFYKSWSNLGEDSTFQIKPNHKPTTVVTIPDGYYNDLGELCTKINECFHEQLPDHLSGGFTFSFDKYTRVVTCRIKRENFSGGSFNWSAPLKAVLGSSSWAVTDENEMTVTFKNSKLSHIFQVMVYSDIVQPSVVGDIETNLLRSVPVSIGNHWEMQCTTFDKIQYIPLSKKTANTISILIYTDYGKPVPFNGGRAVVTLEFRKAKPALFI